MTATLVSYDRGVLTTVATMNPNDNQEYVYTPVGFRHPEGPMAMRVAVEALEPPREDDSEEILEARRLGYAVGRGRVVNARYGVAAVVPGTETSATKLTLALVSLREFDHEDVAEPLLRAAQTIGLRVP